MAKRSIIVIAFLIFSVLLLGCGKREDRTVATVGGKVITVGDMEKSFRAKPDWSPEQADSAKSAALDRLIDDKLFAVKGESMGYGEDEEITKGLEDARKRTMIGELYQKVVVERGKVGEAEVKGYYDKLAEEIKTRHVLVETEEEADSIYRELTKEGGSSFEKLAKECSLDRQTQAKGGDLGWIRWGMLPDAFMKAAFSLGVGEVSKPVKTDRGFHIIKVEDRRDAERRPYEEERERIKGQLERMKQRELATRYLEELKEGAKIEIDESVLKLLAEKTPKQERRMFTPPPLPAVTDEERQKVVVTSTLGEWTVDSVLAEAEKTSRRPPFDQPERIKEFIEYLVTNELLLNKAKAFHLDRSRKVQLMIEREIDTRMMTKFTREEIDRKVEVSEDEISEYYEAHIAGYTQPEKVQVSEILVKTEEEAKEVKRLLRRGADFANLAKERSTHWTKNRGGDLGLFARGRYPEIEDVAFSLRRGRVSDPIKTKDGFAIIKVTKKEEERVQPLEDVKARVESVVKREKREKLKQTILSELREETEIVINRRNLSLVGAGG